MEQLKYWQKQDKQPLFPQIDTAKPERRQLAGRMLIIGGSRASFSGVSLIAEKTIALGVGEVKILLPDSLKTKVPTTPNVIFAPSEPSGGFSREALTFAQPAAAQTDYILLAGDLGKNSETEVFITQFTTSTTQPTLITRDAIDLLAGSAAEWLGQGNTTICCTLPQLQKVFRAVYYPKMITLSMPMQQLVEALHKFTITYPVTIATLHHDQIITAHSGQIVTTTLQDTTYTPINLWSGNFAATIAVLQLWNPNQSLAATTIATQT